MKNPSIGRHEAADIKKLIAKLLQDIGNPEPPLQLATVRDRLNLDLGYYSATDTSLVQDVIHYLKVGGLQVFQRPMLLWEAIRKADLRALFLPDRKRILIDATLPILKHRWAESHEISHSLIPWHADFLQGDSDNELSPTCLAQIEAEANFGAGQLVFLQERFVAEAMDMPLTLKSVKGLKETFGNTTTSTLWRFVEEHRGHKAIVGIVCPHPRRLPDDFDWQTPCRYVVQSPTFRKCFNGTTEHELFAIIQSYCGFQRGGTLGADEVILTDDNGVQHVFHFETFYNSYEALTLGVHLTERAVFVSV